MSTIYPDQNADPYKPSSYNFESSDSFFLAILKGGFEPYLRIGDSWSSGPQFSSLKRRSPVNRTNWIRAAVEVVRHYRKLAGSKLRYVEIWNEPDHRKFWDASLNEFCILFDETARALKTEVPDLKIGGPGFTAAAVLLPKGKFVVESFLDYLQKHHTPVDFISWHHYSKNTDDFGDDLINLNNWLSGEKYRAFQNLPKIISEWGFDSNYNPIADTQIGASYTLASIRNFLNYGYDLAFLFEIKDGPSPSWGILGYQGEKKPRYLALQFLNHLEGEKLVVSGEGTYVKALASKNENNLYIILINYDLENKNTEFVPLKVTNLLNGNYDLTIKYLDGQENTTKNIKIENGILKNVSKIKNLNTVEEYLKLQGRFKHLLNTEEGKKIVDEWKNLIERKIKKYNLLEETK
jgi:hypothetical protein